MAKNIVVCCDGTNGQFRARNTNVVRLYSLLVHDRDQVAFYDPGLGTMSPPGALTRISQVTTRVLGLAFGYGLADRIGEAYQQIMDAYQDGDRIFLFGFSRGAYTVRALAGMIHMFGIVRPGNENLIPYVTAMFRRHDEEIFRLAGEFRKTFARTSRIHFVGAWDTVSSVGWIYDPVKLPYTANNPSIDVGRHAIAIDERRCFFRQNLWGAPDQGQDLRQVWFAGTHSDVGGGYPARESGLANIALRWMLDEAQANGLRLDPERMAEVFSRPENQPDPAGPLHESLEGPWWVLEFWPKPYMDMSLRPPRSRWRIPRGAPRRIPENAEIHPSVFQRMENPALHYTPGNLPKPPVSSGPTPRGA